MNGVYTLIKVMLKSLLKERKITLTKFSKDTGVSIKALSAFQNQKTDGVQYNTLEKISKALDLEIGDIMKRINKVYRINLSFNEQLDEESTDSIKDISAKILFVDNLDKEYTSDLTFSLKYKSDEQRANLNIHIKRFHRQDLPMEINEHINNEVNEANSDGLFNVISYLLVKEVMRYEPFSHLNILDIIRVNWDSSILPRFIINNINADAIEYENERLMFFNREQPINLVPLEPNTAITAHNPDLNLIYTPNIESLSSLPFVYNIVMDTEDFERTIYVTFD